MGTWSMCTHAERLNKYARSSYTWNWFKYYSHILFCALFIILSIDNLIRKYLTITYEADLAQFTLDYIDCLNSLSRCDWINSHHPKKGIKSLFFFLIVIHYIRVYLCKIVACTYTIQSSGIYKNYCFGRRKKKRRSCCCRWINKAMASASLCFFIYVQRSTDELIYILINENKYIEAYIIIIIRGDDVNFTVWNRIV